MFTIERIITFLGAICSILFLLLGYSYLFYRCSLNSIRRKIRSVLSDIRADSFVPDVLICYGRGGSFIGSLVTDELDRTVPILGIDKVYYSDHEGGGRLRKPRIEVPKTVVLPSQYENPDVLIVTGEIVDGISMAVATEFIRTNIPGSNIKTFAMFWSVDSSFRPDYYGFKTTGRQKRLPWKKRKAPSGADYPRPRSKKLG